LESKGETPILWIRGSNVKPQNYPHICVDTGLKCTDCTAATARSLAGVCKGLPARAVTRLFVQIYTDPACAHMHAHFTAAYREASSEEPRGSHLDNLQLSIAAAVA
jgi:hypothetical protein